MREWNNIIQKMIDAFELMKYVHTPSPDENKSIEQGLDLFCKYYRDFTKKAFICDFLPKKFASSQLIHYICTRINNP